MASWDTAQLPSGPSPASYAPPLLNLGWIGDLGKNYFEGTQMGRTRALQTAFKEGLPKNPDGSIDINAMTDTLARLGGAEAAQPLMNLQIQQQIGQGNAGAVGGGGNAPGATAPGGYVPPARAPVPAHGVPSAATAPPDQTPSQPAQPAQADTLTNFVRSQVQDPDRADSVIKLAKASGINEFAPVDPNSADGQRIKRWVAAANGGVTPTGGTAGQPAPQTFAQRADAAFSPYQNGGVPFSQAATPTPADLEARAQTFEQNANAAFRRAAAIGGFPGQGPAATALENYGKQQMEQAKILREQIAKQQELTTEQKNVASGAARAGEQTKLDVKQFGDQYEGIQSAGASAQNQLPQIQLAQGILNHPDFVSGAGNDIILGFRKILAQIDPAHANDAVPQEAFRKVMAANILGQVNALKAEGQAAGMTQTRLFQSQINLMEKAAQNPQTTVAGNRLLTEIAMRHAQQQMQIAQMADNYKQQSPTGGLDPNWNKLLRQYLSSPQHQLFTPAELADPRLIAPPVFRSPQQVAASKLPAGTPIKIMRPDGSQQIRYVPKPGAPPPPVIPGQGAPQQTY